MNPLRSILLPIAGLVLACGGDETHPSSDGGASSTTQGATTVETSATGATTANGTATTSGVGGEGTGGSGGGAGGSGPLTHFHGNYSSPSIVRVGSTYHAYFAAQGIAGQHYNIPHATFTADGNWHFVGEALPHLGQGADEGPGFYPVWAPAVAKIADGEWMLYYTAQVAGSGKMCIWRAHSDNANGPFVDDYAGSMVCSDSGLWSIDPYLVQDAQDVWHLAARIDQAGGINTIQVRALGPHGAGFADGSSWFELTHNAPSSWEQPVLENAGLVRLTPPSGPAHWFVFYSGRAWDDNTYAIGYSDCGEGINGPCVKKTPTGPWLHTIAAQDLYGPGTPTFYTDEAGQIMMSVQAWEHSGGTSNPNNKGQIMRTYSITVDDAYEPSVNLVRVDLQ